MNRNDSIKYDIKQCRKLVEQNLNWEPSTNWTRRDYELLVEKIFEKTGVLLSLSTVRRIWDDDYKNIPHKSTLDALACFAGFSNWYDFIESTYKRKKGYEAKKKGTRGIVNWSFVVIIIIVLSIIIYSSYDCKQIDIVGPVSFSYNQESDSVVPNIVVFDYDVSNIVADSFFIVESTHDYRKKKLSIKKGQLTSSYYHPGSFEAFLVADDSVVKKLNIQILSNSWVAMINYQLKPGNLPFYFYDSDIINQGKLVVTRTQIIDNSIRITDDLFLTISNSFKSSLIANNKFTYNAKVKLDSIEINASCPEIYLGLLFENDFCYIPLVHNGGQDKLQIKYGNTYLTSYDSDLSGFGCDIYNWQEVILTSTGSDIRISINNNTATTLVNSTNLGAFKGFSFTFDGIGSVDYVSMITLSGDTLYYDNFE